MRQKLHLHIAVIVLIAAILVVFVYEKSKDSINDNDNDNDITTASKACTQILELVKQGKAWSVLGRAGFSWSSSSSSAIMAARSTSATATATTSSNGPTTTTTTTKAQQLGGVQPRRIQKTFLAREQSEGAGARVRRSIGTAQQRHLTPFLMLDHFNVPYGAGFPDHPRRGQETITYLFGGRMDHEDFAGNKGTLTPGDLQFMTAGRGIVHAEIPARPNGDGDGDEESAEGIQLWVDLPANLKNCEPRYRDLRAEEIPVATARTNSSATAADNKAHDDNNDNDNDKVEIKVISGRALGVDSVQDLAYTPVWLLDITIHPGGHLVQEIPRGWNVLAYTLAGRTVFHQPQQQQQQQNDLTKEAGAEAGAKAGVEVQPYHCVIFEPQSQHQHQNQNQNQIQEGEEEEQDYIIAHVSDSQTDGKSRFMLIAGQPHHNQPIVQYGPFVTTSRDAVIQALHDFQNHANGFERAENWESEIGKFMR